MKILFHKILLCKHCKEKTTIVTQFFTFFFKIYSKNPKQVKTIQNNVFFFLHLGYSHVFFVIFNYFSLIDIFLKKLNSNKYIFDAFVSISYFFITFIIKLMLTLFHLFFKKAKSKIKIGSKIHMGLKCKKKK